VFISFPAVNKARKFLLENKFTKTCINIKFFNLLFHPRQKETMGDAFQIAEIVDLSSRPFCCRDKGFSGDGQGLFLHFLWPRCAKRQKSRKSPRAPYAIHSHTNALLLIKHTLLIIGLRRSASQSALIISTHTRALGG
jgi:hypothetical protein